MSKLPGKSLYKKEQNFKNNEIVLVIINKAIEEFLIKINLVQRKNMKLTFAKSRLCFSKFRNSERLV